MFVIRPCVCSYLGLCSAHFIVDHPWFLWPPIRPPQPVWTDSDLWTGAASCILNEATVIIPKQDLFFLFFFRSSQTSGSKQQWLAKPLAREHVWSAESTLLSFSLYSVMQAALQLTRVMVSLTGTVFLGGWTSLQVQCNRQNGIV